MEYMNILNKLFEKYKCLEECRKDILQAFDILQCVYKCGGKVLLCGNGGSAADCEHIAGELMKSFKKKRPVPEDFRNELTSLGAEHITDYLQGALCTISLVSQTALITAYSNDESYDYAFAQQVYGYGKSGDALIAISTSGNATSVVNACFTAKAAGLSVIGLTGATGGAIKDICDACICVPSTDTPSVQEMHLPIYHAICSAMESVFW